MKRGSLFTIALLGVVSLIPGQALAGPYESLSETEISEMLSHEGPTEGSAEYSNATPEPESAPRASEEDDEVENEIGQNGVMDALHESSRAETRSGYDSPTPIPAARPEPWMKKSTTPKKKIKKVAKPHHKMKKAKKYSKKISGKKGKHIAATKGKKKYNINKKRFARR